MKKITLVELINRISTREKELSLAKQEVLNNSTKKHIKEATGGIFRLNETVDFNSVYNKYEETQKDLIKMKSLLLDKNNSVIAFQNLTIQQAIVKISLDRKELELLEKLQLKKNETIRNCDYGNQTAYYEVSEINFSRPLIEDKIVLLKNNIFELESAIQKANNETQVDI